MLTRAGTQFHITRVPVQDTLPIIFALSKTRVELFEKITFKNLPIIFQLRTFYDNRRPRLLALAVLAIAAI